MENQTQEARTILAIEAVRSSPKLGRAKAAKLYKIPYSKLTDRMNGRTYRREIKANCQKLTK